MNSEFNTVFNTTINEFVATADATKAMIGHKPLYDKQSKTANTSAASANTDTLSSTTQQFKDHNGGIVKNLMQHLKINLTSKKLLSLLDKSFLYTNFNFLIFFMIT